MSEPHEPPQFHHRRLQQNQQTPHQPFLSVITTLPSPHHPCHARRTNLRRPQYSEEMHQTPPRNQPKQIDEKARRAIATVLFLTKTTKQNVNKMMKDE
jgi:citrate synthase